MEYTLSRLSDELTLATELWKHGVQLFNGITHYEQRKDLARMAIKEFALENTLIGNKSFAEWFIKAYAEKL